MLQLKLYKNDSISNGMIQLKQKKKKYPGSLAFKYNEGCRIVKYCKWYGVTVFGFCHLQTSLKNLLQKYGNNCIKQHNRHKTTDNYKCEWNEKQQKYIKEVWKDISNVW